MDKVEDLPPASLESEQDGASTPNSSKRRKVQQPSQAGLNWNEGSKPAIRTSLGRRAASINQIAVATNAAKKASSTSSPSSSPVDATSETGTQENASNSAASLNPSLTRNAHAHTRYRDQKVESSSDSEPEKGAPSLSKPRGSAAPSVVGSSQVDLETDELYGGDGDQASASAPKRANGTKAPPSDDDSDILQLHTDDELDRGVMINVSDSRATQLPVPDQMDGPPPESAHTRQSPPASHSTKRKVSLSEPAQSSEEGEIHDATASAPPLPPPPPTLADLSTADLQLQVRYFYIGRDLATIPLSDFARCLHCARTGHLTVACPSQTCQHCSSSAHLSTFCPQVTPCSKCLVKGHAAPACPEKLRAVPQLANYTCPRCSRKGHLSSTCELVWRSSEFAYLDLPTDPGAFRRECYKCGSKMHLGNDCRDSEPGQPLGTSSWSLLATSAPPKPPTKLQPSRLVVPREPKAKRPPKPRGLPPPAPGLPPLPPPAASQRGGRPKATPYNRGGGSIAIRGIAGAGRGMSNRPLALQPQNQHPPPPSSLPQAPSGPSGSTGPQGNNHRGRVAKKKGPGRRGGGGGKGRGGGGGGAGGGDAYRPMPSAAAKAWKSGI